jgi:ribosome-binding protein aMBF1 (putative translation factor)
MKNKLYITLEEDLKERLKNPAFKREWEKSELGYQIARQIIAKRLFLKMSQRQLAKKARTTQAIISRIETAISNPTVDLLDRIAKSLKTPLSIRFE